MAVAVALEHHAAAQEGLSVAWAVLPWGEGTWEWKGRSAEPPSARYIASSNAAWQDAPGEDKKPAVPPTQADPFIACFLPTPKP